ncbi:hypothetical protein D3C72_1089680 [compost metagenome]
MQAAPQGWQRQQYRHHYCDCQRVAHQRQRNPCGLQHAFQHRATGNPRVAGITPQHAVKPAAKQQQGPVVQAILLTNGIQGFRGSLLFTRTRPQQAERRIAPGQPRHQANQYDHPQQREQA